MNAINKVSDITAHDLAEYIRLDEVSASEVNTLNTLYSVAKEYICNYTGIAEEDLDGFVVFILVQDMWDNRTMYVDSNNMNKTVETILGMHSVNLLPKVVDANE